MIAENYLSLLLRDVGDLDEAEKHARISVEHADNAFGTDNAYRGLMHDGLATILTREKKYPEAERELDIAWKVVVGDKNFGRDASAQPGSRRSLHRAVRGVAEGRRKRRPGARRK